MAAPTTYPYTSGHCGSGGHARCLGAYGGASCHCACHTEPEPEPEPDPVRRPADRLERAAALVERTDQPMPPGTGPALAQLLRAEAQWSGDRHGAYPEDRAPLLKLADLIIGGPA